MRFLGAALLLFWSVKASCAGDFRAVCSSPILRDWTQRLAAPSAQVDSLLPPETDPHVFQPTPQHVQRLLTADLIIGFDPLLEPWLKQICDSNQLNDKILWLAKPWISDLGNTLACCPHEASGGKHTLLRRIEPVDPHVWTDPELVERMGERLHAEVARRFLGSEGSEGKARLANFVAMTRAVDAEMRKQLGSLGEDCRGIITHHDNLGRMARRYGLRVEGVILRATTTEAADPSAREMVGLVELARRRGVRVVVMDKGQRAPAAETLAREAGLAPPIALRIDTLESEGPGSTWEGMMRENGRRLAEALRR